MFTPGTVVPPVWRADAHHRFHHLQRRHPPHSGTSWGAQTPRITPASGTPLWDGLMRKVLRDGSQRQTETKQHKPPLTSRPISASAAKGKKRDGHGCVTGCN